MPAPPPPQLAKPNENKIIPNKSTAGRHLVIRRKNDTADARSVISPRAVLKKGKKSLGPLLRRTSNLGNADDLAVVVTLTVNTAAAAIRFSEAAFGVQEA